MDTLVMFDKLTDRELDVLRLMVRGLSNREIASELILTYETVRWYTKQIYSKLGVHNRKKAIRKAQNLLIDNSSSVPESMHNLPSSPTPFIGRKKEITNLLQLITNAGTRCIVIQGPGGIGKTRFALEAGRKLTSNAFPDGIFFVPLQGLHSREHLLTTVGYHIGYQFQQDERDSEQQLVDYLSGKQMLLILDNFEQILSAATLVSNILKTASHLKVMITSRERLNIYGETIFHLDGLLYQTSPTFDVPDSDDASELFKQFARQLYPDWQPSHADQVAIHRITALVDGMPLALELAAGWVSVMSPDEIADEIARGSDILVSSLRDIPERHRNIHTMFNYTWDTLSDELQDVYMQLSVFNVPFTKDAAKSIAKAQTSQLLTLINKSLLRRSMTSERYEIHELLRQYAYQHLTDTQHVDIVMARFSHHYLELVETQENNFLSENFLNALNTIDEDIEHIWRALNWTHRHDYQQYCRFVGGLWLYWDSRGLYDEVQQYIKQCLEDTGIIEPNVLGKIYFGASNFEFVRGQYDSSLKFAQLAVENYEESQNIKWTARALSLMGAVYIRLGEWETAKNYLTDAILRSRAIQDSWGLGTSLGRMARVAPHVKYETSPADLMTEAIAAVRKSGDARALGYALLWAGRFTANELKQAINYFYESLDLFDYIGDQRGKAIVLGQLAKVYIKNEDFEQAQKVQEQALNLSSNLGDERGVLQAHRFLTTIMYEMLDYNSAIFHCLKALSLLQKLKHQHSVQDLLSMVVLLLLELDDMVLATVILGTLEDTPAYEKYDLDTTKTTLENRMSIDAFMNAHERGKTLSFDLIIGELLHKLAHHLG